MSTTFPLAGQPIPRLRSARPAVDPEGFFDVVGQALQLHIAADEVPAGTSPFYQHAFPKDRLGKTDQPFDGITFKVLSSVPAQVSNDGTVRRNAFTFESEALADNYTQKSMVWLELLTVEFTIWSKSNPTRSSLVTWFHRFLLRYANVYKFFEARGADKFQFVGRGEDGFETREQQLVYFGTLTYQVRIQFLDSFTERQLTQLTVDVALGNDQQTILQSA